MSETSNYTKRRLLRCGSDMTAAGLFHMPLIAKAATSKPIQLTAGAAQTNLLGVTYGETAIWAYNNSVLGSVIRAHQSERIQVLTENRLNEETTILWHGLRAPIRITTEVT